MVAKFRTLDKHLGHEIVCEEYDDSIVIMCDRCGDELMVGDDGAQTYHELKKHVSHDIQLDGKEGIISIKCKTCNEVLATVEDKEESEQVCGNVEFDSF